MPNYFIPGPNKNFIGSSGFNANGTRITTSPGATAATATSGVGDFPVMSPDGSGLLVHKNGSPFTGINPYNQKTYANGREVTPPPGTQFIPGTTKAIDVNDPNQVLKPFALPKNPEVTSGANALVDQFKKTAASSIGDFSSYLAQFKDQLSSASSKGKTATDLTGYENNLNAAQNRYSGALDTSLAGAAQANTDAAAREAAIQAQNRADLGTFTSTNERARQDAESAAQGYVSRYAMAQGGQQGSAPRLNSDVIALSLDSARRASLPYDMALANKRFDLNNTDLGISQGQSARESQFFQSFQPSVAGSRYGSSASTINAVQQARERAAAGDFQNAARLLELAGAPQEMIARIAAGDTSVLAALNQLLSQSQNQGVSNILGVNVSQPQGFQMPSGGLPASRYVVPNSPVTYGGSPSTAGTGTGNYLSGGDSVVNPAQWAAFTASQNRYANPNVVAPNYSGVSVPNPNYGVSGIL